MRYLARRKTNYTAKDWRRFTYQDGILVPDAVEVTGGIVGHRIALHPRPDVQRREKRQAARCRPPRQQRGEVLGPVDVQPGLLRRQHARRDAGISREPTVAARAVRTEARIDRAGRAAGEQVGAAVAARRNEGDRGRARDAVDQIVENR